MIRNARDISVFQSEFFTFPDPPPGAPNYQVAHTSRAEGTISLLTLKYAADANAANRLVTIGRWATATFYPFGSTAFPITSNQTITVIGCHNAPANSATSQDYLYLPLPDLPLLDSDYFIAFLFENAQAADQVSNIRVYEKLWVTAK